MDIQPTGNRVLVERLKTTDITAGGLYIPENAKEKSNVAKVIAVGPGRRVLQDPPYGEYGMTTHQSLVVKVDDKVLFGKYSGVDFEHEGKTLLFLREEEISAILLDNVSVVQ